VCTQEIKVISKEPQGKRKRSKASATILPRKIKRVDNAVGVSNEVGHVVGSNELLQRAFQLLSNVGHQHVETCRIQKWIKDFKTSVTSDSSEASVTSDSSEAEDESDVESPCSVMRDITIMDEASVSDQVLDDINDLFQCDQTLVVDEELYEGGDELGKEDFDLFFEADAEVLQAWQLT